MRRAPRSPPRPRQPGERAERAEPVGRAPTNDPAAQRRDERDEDRQRTGKSAVPREQKCANRKNTQVRDGKRGSLLRKRERKFPYENDGRVYKKRKSSVLKFAGKIAADPGIRTQEGPVTFRPTARHIGEHGQDRQFIVVIPKNERIVPEKNEAERNDN